MIARSWGQGLGWEGGGPGSGPMQMLRPPGMGWWAAGEGLRRSGWARLAEAERRARGRGLVQFPRRFVLKCARRGFSPCPRCSPRGLNPPSLVSPHPARTTAVIFQLVLLRGGVWVVGERAVPSGNLSGSWGGVGVQVPSLGTRAPCSASTGGSPRELAPRCWGVGGATRPWAPLPPPSGGGVLRHLGG